MFLLLQGRVVAEASVSDQNRSLTVQIEFSPLDILFIYCAVKMIHQ